MGGVGVVVGGDSPLLPCARLPTVMAGTRVTGEGHALAMVWQVPAPIVESVVAVPCGEDPGRVVASGPADATASGDAERQDAEVEAARQARYISAFEEQVQDLNGQEQDGVLEVVALINHPTHSKRRHRNRWRRS